MDLSLEGAVSTVGGKLCERDMEARSLRLMDVGFVSQRTWELDCLISKLPAGSHIAGFLWFQASAGCGSQRRLHGGGGVDLGWGGQVEGQESREGVSGVGPPVHRPGAGSARTSI